MYLVCEQHIGIPSILGNVHAGSAIFSKRFLPIMDINSFLLCFVILTSRFGQYCRTVLRDRLYSSIVTETLPILLVFISLGHHSCRKYIPHKTLLVFIIYRFKICITQIALEKCQKFITDSVKFLLVGVIFIIHVRVCSCYSNKNRSSIWWGESTFHET